MRLRVRAAEHDGAARGEASRVGRTAVDDDVKVVTVVVVVVEPSAGAYRAATDHRRRLCPPVARRGRADRARRGTVTC